MGTSFVFLDAGKPDCMLKECNLGNVATDAFVLHYANLTASETQWTEASVAIQNSGSITSSMFVNAQGTACSRVLKKGRGRGANPTSFLGLHLFRSVCSISVPFLIFSSNLIPRPNRVPVSL